MTIARLLEYLTRIMCRRRHGRLHINATSNSFRVIDRQRFVAWCSQRRLSIRRPGIDAEENCYAIAAEYFGGPGYDLRTGQHFDFAAELARHLDPRNVAILLRSASRPAAIPRASPPPSTPTAVTSRSCPRISTRKPARRSHPMTIARTRRLILINRCSCRRRPEKPGLSCR